MYRVGGSTGVFGRLKTVPPGAFQMYFRVRRACLVEGMSVREASRVFDLHRDTVRKMLDNATPQGCTRQSPPRRPKLEPYAGVIDAILEADAKVARKQRHTAKRIFERCGTSTVLRVSTP